MALKQIWPAPERNKEPIWEVLAPFFKFFLPDKPAVFFEIASGSGQHIHHFSGLCDNNNIIWQPSDVTPDSFKSVIAYAEERKNVRKPAIVDIRIPWNEWNVNEPHIQPGTVDIMYAANLLHYAEFECTKGLFYNASVLLKPDGQLFIYGPFCDKGKAEPSNLKFDKTLRVGDPQRGLRDITYQLLPLATEYQLTLTNIFLMPSNNRTLRFVRVRNT